ncbi:MAG: hypothetical protein C0518_14225 [Opitutus sp.]|nr:hypothetical protein [Opitutus sp.]
MPLIRTWTNCALVVAAAITCFNWTVFPLAACEIKILRVSAEKSGNTVRLFASSDQLTEAYIEVSAQLENMRSSRPLPAWVEMKDRGPVPLVTLSQANAAQAWRYNYRYSYKYGLPGGRHDESASYLLPYPRGTQYRVLQGRGGSFSHQPGSPSANAIDFDLPEGATISAARDGVVVGIKQDSDHGGPDRKFDQCANFVLIRHADGSYADYLHLQQNGALVALGQRVKAGDPIGRSGNTGWSTRPHLHFVVYQLDAAGQRLTLPVAFKVGTARLPDLQRGVSYRHE